VYIKEAAPYGLMNLDDEAEFTEHYRERLDGVGIEAFQQRFAEISDTQEGRGLVFLCFEPVGQFCHRHLFARWIEEQTGQHVSELGDEGHEPWLVSSRCAEP
jgi:hypothetical protein